MKTRLLLAFIFLIEVHQGFAQTDSKPLAIGVTEQFRSTILGETRTINIYLPENFNANDTIHYPVIYIPDGGIEEDFIHITGLVRYNTQPWIDRFPKSIVVGIENTNRRRDFTFPVANLDFLEKIGFTKDRFPSYGGSASYIAFLEKELQPYIQNKYKASRQRTIISESLGGLLLTEILLKHPNLFDTYIIISPSLWWGDGILLNEANNLLKANLNRPIKVVVAAPEQAEDVRMYTDAEALYKVLKQNKNCTVFFDYLPDELHSTVIHQAVYNAFKRLYPKTAYSK
jgi:predicted alpha/beta superfamily hydrolase